MVWYSYLFQNFPEFIVIHTVKGFGRVNKVEIDVFLELSCFFDDPTDVGNLISGAQAWKPGSQHAGQKRGVAGLLLGRTERAARAAELQLCAQAR